jgi:REP element-mobilizing transposase RayT
MPHSVAKVLIHIVFSTKQRIPFLADRAIRDEMHAYLSGTCSRLRCTVLKVGGAPDHVHILCVLSRNLSIAELVGDIKRGSSKWIKTKDRKLTEFAWQSGYRVFSVAQQEVQRLMEFIGGQEEHHRSETFHDEFRSFRKEYRVDYDQRYVWD